MLWSAMAGMKEWLLRKSEERRELRRAPRFAQPEIVVHYWDGAAPEGRRILDISQSGAYICTPERWYVGTIVRLVLQKYPAAAFPEGATIPAGSTCIPARVVRHGRDGVAVEFAFRDKKEEKTLGAFLAAIMVPPVPDAPPDKTRRMGGQALVEFALMVPLVFLLGVNALNLGGFLFAWITVANAARSGAQYMVMSSASPGAPTPATPAQIATLVTNDVSSLLNRSSLVVAICANKTAAPNGCTSLFDPEAPAYTLATVDVTYTYKPFIPLFSFPRLGISATLPAGSIHRKAVMRMLQ